MGKPVYTKKLHQTNSNSPSLTTAIEKPQITKLSNGAINDFFIVGESEAAAAYSLTGSGCASRLTDQESFFLLNCGGGTVDTIIYTLLQQELRWLKEEIRLRDVSCGSSFLNARYKRLSQDELEEALIIGNGSSLEQIVASKV